MVFGFILTGIWLSVAGMAGAQTNNPSSIISGDFDNSAPTQSQKTRSLSDAQVGSAVISVRASNSAPGAIAAPQQTAGGELTMTRASIPGGSESAGSVMTDNTQGKSFDSRGQTAQTAPEPPTSPAEANKLVEDLLRSGDKEGALSAAREARKQWPDDKNLLAFDKIVGYKSPNIFGKARQLARELLDGIAMQAGSMPGGHAARWMSGQPGADGPIMAGAISLPGATSAWPTMAADTRAALSALAIHDYQKLDEKMSSLLAGNPNDYRAYRGRAFARWKLGRNAEAVADARHAIALEPHDLLSRAALVDALVDMKQPKEAVMEADRGFNVVQGLPPNLDAAHLFYARSRAWGEMNQEDREFDDIWRAAELQPNAYGAMAQDARKRRTWNSLFEHLRLPDDPLAQLGIGAAGAALLLFPPYFLIGWWRRRR